MGGVVVCAGSDFTGSPAQPPTARISIREVSSFAILPLRIAVLSVHRGYGRLFPPIHVLKILLTRSSSCYTCNSAPIITPREACCSPTIMPALRFGLNNAMAASATKRSIARPHVPHFPIPSRSQIPFSGCKHQKQPRAAKLSGQRSHAAACPSYAAPELTRSGTPRRCLSRCLNRG